jgi:hypothetical protein
MCELRSDLSSNADLSGKFRLGGEHVHWESCSNRISGCYPARPEVGLKIGLFSYPDTILSSLQM